jgi:RNA polymerase sigma-70 factor (ECF subfamily)
LSRLRQSEGWNKQSHQRHDRHGYGADTILMAQRPAPLADDHAWAAFEAEALPHVDRLFHLALWFERNRHEAEDLVQETMIQALQSFHRFQSGTNCRAWLVTILQHVRNNRHRARQRSPLVDDPDDRIAHTTPFVAPVPQDLTDEDVLGALGRIPVQYQEVIVLCDVEELTYKEIAEALAIPIGTVMSRLHRGRALLRSELGASGAAPGRRRAET